MALILLLLVLHAVVVSLVMMGCALHTKLAPVPAPAPVVEPDPQESLAGRVLPQPSSGQPQEEYVAAGLLDLRIMLAQAARRGRE